MPLSSFQKVKPYELINEKLDILFVDELYPIRSVLELLLVTYMALI